MATNRRYRGPTAPGLFVGAASKLAAALVVGSIVTAAFGAYWLLLSPSDVVAGAVWQPITYCFIETSPQAVLFAAVILVSIGGQLESWWGGRRLAQFLVGVTIASGLATMILALGFSQLRHAHFAGGGAMVSAVWCAYGWTIGRTHTSFWGIPVTGNQLAAAGLGLVVLKGAFGSTIHVLPEAIAVALTYAYLRRRAR